VQAFSSWAIEDVDIVTGLEIRGGQICNQAAQPIRVKLVLRRRSREPLEENKPRQIHKLEIDSIPSYWPVP
jgi:hypothetical protein